MKQLDEMERMARSRVESEPRDLRDIAECRRLEAIGTLTGAAHEATIAAAALGRLLLAVMPTIRAALDWRDANPGSPKWAAKSWLLRDAIDDLRRRLGGE